VLQGSLIWRLFRENHKLRETRKIANRERKENLKGKNEKRKIKQGEEGRDGSKERGE
jgi:hypothetical protein